MDKEAINAIVKLGLDAAAAGKLDTNTPAYLHDGKVINLEALQAGRSRYRGTFTTTVLSEFAEYVKANKGGSGFIDLGHLAATVFFNLGNPTSPGHADWRGILRLDPTAGYVGLNSAVGQRLTQRQMVEWCEDWAPNLSARFLPAPGGNGSDPEDTSIATALLALRNLTISAKSDATHTDRDFGATKSTLEAIEAKAETGLPTHLVFTTEPYLGFQQRQFFLRLSVSTIGDKPHLILRAVGMEAMLESIADEFKTKLLAAIGDAATMTIGSFTP